MSRWFLDVTESLRVLRANRMETSKLLWRDGKPIRLRALPSSSAFMNKGGTAALSSLGFLRAFFNDLGE